VDLNDELLCAYLDDELDVAQRKQVTAALAADAGAQLRLQRMRDADRDLQAALPLQGDDHFEAAMKARILGTAPALRWHRHVLPWAAAAGFAGLFAGYLLPRSMTQSGDELMQLAPAVQAMLETRPSGATADGLGVVLTFKAGDSRFCRVFRGGSGAAAGEGLACRTGNGSWQLTGWDAGTASADAFRPAGASPVVDAAMTALGGEPALDAQAEAQLISQGWRAP
jgi:hypothetical protein